jgi:hypothetical protein
VLLQGLKQETVCAFRSEPDLFRETACGLPAVPVCLSASHIAYGSIRMEPVFMILGQSAATAACLAIDNNTTVQELAYNALKEQLLKDKQILQNKR